MKVNHSWPSCNTHVWCVALATILFCMGAIDRLTRARKWPTTTEQTKLNTFLKLIHVSTQTRTKKYPIELKNKHSGQQFIVCGELHWKGNRDSTCLLCRILAQLVRQFDWNNHSRANFRKSIKYYMNLRIVIVQANIRNRFAFNWPQSIFELYSSRSVFCLFVVFEAVSMTTNEFSFLNGPSHTKIVFPMEILHFLCRFTRCSVVYLLLHLRVRKWSASRQEQENCDHKNK